MSLPCEKINAVLKTKDFLINLLNPKETPKVPKIVREMARDLLKHYPWSTDEIIIKSNLRSKYAGKI